jgi:DNA polymerase III subunit gamma/tau
VHMLSAAASNALLKTLEEPPGHVVFVLATTDPQKVLPTIRSRTQHFEFRLLNGDSLADLVRHVQADAGLDLPSDAVDLAVRRGNGSARDALSALDQIAAAGTVEESPAVLDELVGALADRDAGRALVAVAEATAAGWDAQRLATDLVEQLRWGFLATMAPTLVPLTDEARARVDEQGRRLGPAALVRSVEVVGEALVEMRDALDPRATLEVALVRLARPDADHSPEALLERIEILERRLSGQGPPTPSARGSQGPTPQPAPSRPPPSAEERGPGGRAALGAVRRQARLPGPTGGPPTGGPPSGSQPSGPAPTDAHPPGRSADAAGNPEQAGGSVTGQPDRDELVKAWGDSVLSSLKGRARARFRAGRFVAGERGVATFALPDATHRSYAEECRADVEDALRAHFGVPISLRLVVDDDSPLATPATTGAPAAPTSGAEPPPVEDPPDPDELTDVPPGATTVEARLLQAFPGAQEVPGLTSAPPGGEG